MTQGAQELDPAKRIPIYREVQEIIMSQALCAPLWDRNDYIGLRANVRDFGVDLRGYFQLYDTWLAKG
jgi:ABC-type transport system substrate-binding protein